MRQKGKRGEERLRQRDYLYSLYCHLFSKVIFAAKENEELGGEVTREGLGGEESEREKRRGKERGEEAMQGETMNGDGKGAEESKM